MDKRGDRDVGAMQDPLPARCPVFCLATMFQRQSGFPLSRGIDEFYAITRCLGVEIKKRAVVDGDAKAFYAVGVTGKLHGTPLPAARQGAVFRFDSYQIQGFPQVIHSLSKFVLIGRRYELVVPFS